MPRAERRTGDGRLAPKDYACTVSILLAGGTDQPVISVPRREREPGAALRTDAQSLAV